LNTLLKKRKESISAFRFKAKYFEGQLKQTLSQPDTVFPDRQEITKLVDSLLITQNESNTACDSTIETLESIIRNQDSAITFHQQIEQNLKEVNRSQEVNMVYLSQQLNNSLSENKRNKRQKKLLSSGILILTGITASLLISRRLK